VTTTLDHRRSTLAVPSGTRDHRLNAAAHHRPGSAGQCGRGAMRAGLFQERA
jgi:hypothetical protein